MPEKIKEGYLATLGVAAITYDKAVEISKKLIKQGELAKDKQKKFVENLIQESKKNVKEMTKLLNEKMEYLARKGEPIKEKQDKLLKEISEKVRETGDFAEIKIKDIVQEAKEKTRAVKDRIVGNDEEKIKKALEELDIPTREDLKEIRKKLDILIDKLDKGKTGQEEQG
jgi:polyhydroxyalkanoate synthesis regulator phasin